MTMPCALLVSPWLGPAEQVITNRSSVLQYCCSAHPLLARRSGQTIRRANVVWGVEQLLWRLVSRHTSRYCVAAPPAASASLKTIDGACLPGRRADFRD